MFSSERPLGVLEERHGVIIKMSATIVPSFLPALREKTEFSKLCLLSGGKDICSQLLLRRQTLVLGHWFRWGYALFIYKVQIYIQYMECIFY